MRSRWPAGDNRRNEGALPRQIKRSESRPCIIQADDNSIDYLVSSLKSFFSFSPPLPVAAGEFRGRRRWLYRFPRVAVFRRTLHQRQRHQHRRLVARNAGFNRAYRKALSADLLKRILPLIVITFFGSIAGSYSASQDAAIDLRQDGSLAAPGCDVAVQLQRQSHGLDQSPPF